MLLATPEFSWDDVRTLSRSELLEDPRYQTFRDQYMSVVRELPAETVREAITPVLVSAYADDASFDAAFLKSLETKSPDDQLIQYEYLHGLLRLALDSGQPYSLMDFYAEQLRYCIDETLLLLLYCWFTVSGETGENDA